MELKCPFASPITSGRARCVHAREVVRRGGSEYDCQEVAAHERCTELHARLKTVALSAFQVQDDLTEMPHSVLVKIQGGGLTGLQRLMDGDPTSIDDVSLLVEQAIAHYGGLGALPVERLASDITGFKLERRTRRRS
ncbi:hypothetical protein [Halochromatium sp.]